MKFWQLTSLLREHGSAIASAAATEQDWAVFGEWLTAHDELVRGQDRQKLDFELPNAFVRAVLGRINLPFYLSRDALRSHHPESGEPETLTILEAFDLFGGAAIEDAREYGSWPAGGRSAEVLREAYDQRRAGIADDLKRTSIMANSSEAVAWETMENEQIPATWPMRPILLALIGLATGLAAHFLLGDGFFDGHQPSVLTLAELATLTVTAGLIGFTIERRLWWASVAFALAFGVVAGAVVWWNGEPQAWSGGDGWRMLCLFLAIGIAAPLFQAARDAEGLRFPYASVHDYAWTNAVLWAACWVFVGIAFALAFLLAALFHLIKIDFLQHLLEKNWFTHGLCGLAFGAALGLLREHGAVVKLLQRVVAMVLAVLAPVLAVGLLLFVAALPFTGLGALWEATSATTPILLACVVGSLILANAVIGDVPEHERRSPALRFGAMGLALVILPLAVIAAIAVGLRIGQYGFTPERLWALTFVIIATAFGLAYLVSLVRGRLNWAEKVRPANLNLAFALCGVALLLATPLVSFNAISTRDQVARLESGRLTPEKFDWRALAFDFGQPGRDALKKLQASANPAVKARATEVAKAESRYEVMQDAEAVTASETLATRMRILPAGAALPDELRSLIVRRYECARNEHCTLLLLPESKEALLFSDDCFGVAQQSGAVPVFPTVGACMSGQRFSVAQGKWTQRPLGGPDEWTEAQKRALLSAYQAGAIEIRTLPRRQVFVGGVPVGEPFE